LLCIKPLKTEGPDNGYASFSAAITSNIPEYYSQLRSHQYNNDLPPNESERLSWKNSKLVASFY
ncbi:IS3 family transposase, partial [Klebsiella pneumoniae]|nr:IS3 family transposase [Klebsiella pneumoniae]